MTIRRGNLLGLDVSRDFGPWVIGPELCGELDARGTMAKVVTIARLLWVVTFAKGDC